MAMADSRLLTISIGIKLKVRSFTTIRLNYILVFAAILSAAYNLDTDAMRPAGRLFRRRCWPPDQRPTIRIDGGARGLSTKPPFATNANE